MRVGERCGRQTHGAMPWLGTGSDGRPREYFIWGATAAMLRDWDLQSTLLRNALQAEGLACEVLRVEGAAEERGDGSRAAARMRADT